MIPVASNQLRTLNCNRITASRSSYLQRQGVRYFRQNVLQRAKEPLLAPLQLPFLRQMDGFLHYSLQKQMIPDRSKC